MALSDISVFLEEVLVRFDPDIDISDGSRARAEIIEPILARVGTDPFDEDIHTFIRERVRQAYPNIAMTEIDEFTDMVVDPMRVIMEPAVREIKLVKLRSVLRNFESLSEDEVDALMGNFFVARRAGGFAIGVVRAYFASPQSISISLVNPATTGGGRRFFPTRPQQITADQMLLNVEGSEYYFDINYTAENRGEDYNVEPNEIKSIANLPTSTRVRNIRRFRDGAPRETSSEYVGRVERSQGDKTLTVQRGIISTLTESFPAIRRIFSVGFRDPEMLRDVIKGGALGPIPDADVSGDFFGSGVVSDDLDADTTSPIISATGGNFISRIGAIGSTPDGWFVTVVYDAGSGLVATDAEILEVISDTEIRTSHEIPVLTVITPTAVTWMLRRRTLTISDIPGGIALPDTADGSLEITSDEVHIGGKTDVYVAGETEESTSQITSLTDEEPLAKGFDAATAGTDVVTLNDVGSLYDDIEYGMSLVLEEGVDANSYRIIEILGSDQVRLDATMTGTQGNLSWKVVDEISVELTDPKNIKIEGSDLVTAAGSAVITTTGASNFLDANVQVEDIIEILDPDFGGEFTVQEVNAVSLVMDPVAPRTLGSAPYRIFTRSEAVEAPVVRIKSMELLDSGGAPSGTEIPYRDPVFASSNAFQNEGGGFIFDGLVRAGISTTPWSSPAIALNGSFSWETYDPDRIWAGRTAFGTVVIPAAAYTPDTLAALISADATLQAAGVSAVAISTGIGTNKIVGFVTDNHFRITADTGSVLTTLGLFLNHTNAHIDSDLFPDFKLRAGDIVEFIDGNNAGVTARTLEEMETTTGGITTRFRLGSGPVGPGGTTALYNNAVLRPGNASRVRIARPSVGSARVYFLDPTSVEFDYAVTRFTVQSGVQELVYIPDPENVRTIRPAPPSTDLPNTGETDEATNRLTDLSANFLLYNIKEGDLLDILYQPITGTVALAASGNIVVSGGSFKIRLDSDPFITITFPFDMPRQDIADYINEQVGEDIASIDGGGFLVMTSSHHIEIDDVDASIVTALGLTTSDSDHPAKGTYIIIDVTENYVSTSAATPITVGTGTVSDTVYKIRRYLQRTSSTEMNENLDASGLYYADVELQGIGPGDSYNIAADVQMAVTGHRSDGFRLRTDNVVTSFSRSEVLFAEISRSIILVGSPDDPVESVQLSQQNVQVSYDRSQLVDEVQSFVDSEFQRVICEEILVKHLLPHYVSLSWSYSNGSVESEMLRAIQDQLDAVEPDTELEVLDVTDVLKRRGATSVFTPDSRQPTGRVAPFFIVVYHDTDRSIKGLLVKDFVDTVRTQRYIPDNITLHRLSSSGIR